MRIMSAQRSPRRKRRQISQNVRELHKILAVTLDDAERRLFIQSLNQYQKIRNIEWLAYSLDSILDTPRKREIYPQLRKIIPVGEQTLLDRYWYTAEASDESPSQSHSKLSRKLPNSLPEHRDRYASADSGVDVRGPPSPRKASPIRQELKINEKYPIKRLYLKRNANTGFGFSIRGGSEHGVGLYISLVDKSSISEKQGLSPGDHVLFVNGTKFDGLTHTQAVQFIQKHRKLDMVVRSVGRIPGTYVAETTYKWVDAKGRQVSPPPTVDSLGRDIEDMHKSELRLLGDDDERKVNLFVEDGAKLGLMVRGGAEYGLGIYIAGVHSPSLAEKAGLKTGEQILDVNGKSFINITHKEAIKILKSTKNMMFTLKDVGKLPFARTTEDRTTWIDGSGAKADKQRRHTLGAARTNKNLTSEQSLFHRGIAGSQLLYNGTGSLPSQKNFIEEQARLVLNDNELGTLCYYLDEYRMSSITINAFVLALFDLLNSPAKESLLSDIRGLVVARDLDLYDELIMQREIESITEITHKKLFRRNEDSDSLHSYDSTLSSLSARGSLSSPCSTKESLDADSRPVTPSQVLELIPSNVESSLARHSDEGGIPFSFLADTTLNNCMEEGCGTADLVILGSRTNGEVTFSSETGGNERNHNSHSETSSLAVLNGDGLHSEGKSGFEIPDGGYETNEDSFSSKSNVKSLPPVTKSSNSSPVKNEMTTCDTNSNQKTVINSPLITSISSKSGNSTNSVETTFQRNAEKSLSKPDGNCGVGLLPSVSKEDEKVTLRPVQNVAAASENCKPFGGSVMNKVLKFNEIADKESSAVNSIRRNSRASSRKSWDGVEGSHNNGEDRNQSQFEQSRDKNRSHSDTNLMERLPKEEQKSFNVKLRASQELFELHHQSKPKKETATSITLSKPALVDNASTISTPCVTDTNDFTKTSSYATMPSTKATAGEFDVEIEKSSLNLGLVIEGGWDTPQRNIKVKCIKEGDYAACKCNALRPGLTIVRVNGKPLDGMPNGVAVMTIRQAYTNHDTPSLVLTVKDS